MTTIATADLHLTDRAADEYRWPLFEWIRERAKELNAEELLILGDLTVAKDRHSSKLVNRLFDELVNLSAFIRIIILKGNHDYVDPTNPFFRFIDSLQNVDYVINPGMMELSIGKATFVPCGVPWNFKVHQFPFLFTHVTFSGSEVENGRLLPGVDPAILDEYEGRCFAGDIHVPQKIRRNIEYVGAPYHIRFGDVFDPRILVIRDEGKTFDLHFPAPRKHVVEIHELTELDKSKIPAGDQVKVRCYLRRAEYDQRRDIFNGVKQIAADKGWMLVGPELLPIPISEGGRDRQSEIRGLSPEELVEAYAKRHKASADHLAMGKELLSSGQ